MQKWEYFVANCYYDDNCKLCLDERKKPTQHWTLHIRDDKHYQLQDGLNAMGANGWELVTVQYRSPSTWDPPRYLYIFKRPEGE